MVTAALFSAHDSNRPWEQPSQVGSLSSVQPPVAWRGQRGEGNRANKRTTTNKLQCKMCGIVARTSQRLANHLASSHGVIKQQRQKAARRGRRSVGIGKVVTPMKRIVTATRVGVVGAATVPTPTLSRALREPKSALTGLTPRALAWAERAISPCDERFGTGAQIPDMSVAKSAVLTERIITTIAAIGTGTTWNLIIATPPLPDVAFLYKAYDSSVDPISVDWKTVTYRDINFGTLALPGGASVATSPTLPGEQDTLNNYATGYRQTMKGLTVELNASALTNQGMVLTAQYADMAYIKSDTVYIYNGASTIVGEPLSSNVGPAIILKEIPQTTDAMFAKDPQAVRMRARMGSYMPLKFNLPVSVMEAVETTELHHDGTGAESDAFRWAMPVFIEGDGSTGAGHGEYQPIIISDHSGPYKNVLATCGMTNMQVGQIFFEGLSPNASIDVKTIASLEVVAAAPSPWAGFMEDAPPESDEAQKQVHAIQRYMPSGHPAKDNLTGALLNFALPIISHIAGPLIRYAANKFGGSIGRAQPVPRYNYVGEEAD